jgi:hypothetical protein
VLTTRVLPSCGLWLRSVSRTRKNFSESIIASHNVIVSEDLSSAALVQFDHLLAMLRRSRPGRAFALFDRHKAE